MKTWESFAEMVGLRAKSKAPAIKISKKSATLKDRKNSTSGKKEVKTAKGLETKEGVSVK